MNSSLLKKVRQFDNKLGSYEERRNFINDTYQDLDVMESAMEDSNIARTLEEQATYLLNSKDVESGRKQIHSYYRSETDYRSNYLMGENSIATDIEKREDLHETVDPYSATTTNITIEYINKLFNLDNMSIEEKKRMIKIGLKEKDNANNGISNVMSNLYEYIIDILKEDDVDVTIVRLCSEGFTELEIASELMVSRRSINKRINRICERKI